MTTSESPRVFVSHASEDKPFVLEFARLLREAGIDAWVDAWELQPGDSLVQRIFDEGIKNAAAFVVVLSKASAAKRWVREELDAGVIKHIEEGTRLIPVRLDDAPVPEALRSKVWINAEASDPISAASRVADAVYGAKPDKPPLGPRPAYVQRAAANLGTGSATDDAVLSALCNAAFEQQELAPRLEDVLSSLHGAGYSDEILSESFAFLNQRGWIQAKSVRGGLPYQCVLRPRALLTYLESTGVDTNELERATAADVWNRATSVPGSAGSVDGVVLRIELPVEREAVMTLLHQRGLIANFNRFAGGRNFMVSGLSPLLRRVASGNG
jgi:hypothetical protein